MRTPTHTHTRKLRVSSVIFRLSILIDVGRLLRFIVRLISTFQCLLTVLPFSIYNNKYRPNCWSVGVKERLVLQFICVCICYLLWVIFSLLCWVSDIISCFVCVCLISPVYREWRTSWASFTNSTQRTSAWNPVSFSFYFFPSILLFVLDCTIVISVGIFVVVVKYTCSKVWVNWYEFFSLCIWLRFVCLIFKL